MANQATLQFFWIADRDEAMHVDAGCDELHIPRVQSALDYATCLHEIGHMLGRHQRSKSTMVCERWAWQWAREQALAWTAEMEQDAQEAIAKGDERARIC